MTKLLKLILTLAICGLLAAVALRVVSKIEAQAEFQTVIEDTE